MHFIRQCVILVHSELRRGQNIPKEAIQYIISAEIPTIFQFQSNEMLIEDLPAAAESWQNYKKSSSMEKNRKTLMPLISLIPVADIVNNAEDG